jgi:hypothetical protein
MRHHSYPMILSRVDKARPLLLLDPNTGSGESIEDGRAPFTPVVRCPTAIISSLIGNYLFRGNVRPRNYGMSLWPGIAGRDCPCQSETSRGFTETIVKTGFVSIKDDFKKLSQLCLGVWNTCWLTAKRRTSSTLYGSSDRCCGTSTSITSGSSAGPGPRYMQHLQSGCGAPTRLRSPFVLCHSMQVHGPMG